MEVTFAEVRCLLTSEICLHGHYIPRDVHDVCGEALDGYCLQQGLCGGDLYGGSNLSDVCVYGRFLAVYDTRCL